MQQIGAPRQAAVPASTTLRQIEVSKAAARIRPPVQEPSPQAKGSLLRGGNIKCAGSATRGNWPLCQPMKTPCTCGGSPIGKCSRLKLQAATRTTKATRHRSEEHTSE